MTKKAIWLLAAALLLLAAACKTASSDEEAIRASILQHLQQAGNLNLAAMDTQFQQITVNGDHAQANVLFRTKQEGATMQMTYQLERRAGQWTVLSSRPAGGQISHPPVDSSNTTSTDTAPPMPRFHVPSDTAPKPAKP
jgi:hypothetical protein